MATSDKITKTRVEQIKPGSILYDSEIKGFVARSLSSGRVSYGFRYRNPAGESKWITLGLHGNITVDQARTLAKKRAGEVADDRDPGAEREKAKADAVKADRADENTVSAVLDEFTKRHASNLRSADQVAHAFTYVRKAIGATSIYALRRSDVVKMLDKIADDKGPVMADRVLAHLRKALNWQAIRDDEFASPIVAGMAKTKPAERARDRILADDEIRDIWTALETAAAPACYPRFVKMLLLCAARRNEIADAQASEIEGEVLTIPAARCKSKRDHAIPLTTQARDLIGDTKGFLFSSTDGEKAFSGFSKAKHALDKSVAKVRKAAGRSKMPQWQLHDLRRTARSLMSRAGVDADVSERCLGHAIAGVRGVYDRYAYLDEKRKAFEALAALVNTILNPPAGNVISIRKTS